MTKNEAVEIVKNNKGKDRIKLSRLEKIDEPDSLKILKDKVDSLIPRIDFPELLLEANRMSGFTDECSRISDNSLRVFGIDVSLCAVKTVNSGPNKKYYGPKRGLTYYNFVSDQNAGFHGIVITGTLRDSLYLLDGMQDQQTSLDIKEIMTDTAGASEIIFALFWLLGYQFSPRLADVGGARFWRIDTKADYGSLNDISNHKINEASIRKQCVSTYPILWNRNTVMLF